MNKNIETALIHSSTQQWDEQETGAINIPIYLSSTFHQNNFDKYGAYDYSRSGNPTRTALENKIAILENGVRGFAFASGMAAISSALLLLKAGDHIVITEDVYGGTYRFVTTILNKFNITYTFVDATDLNAIETAIQKNTALIYIETPSNPCLTITDIEGVVAIAKKHQCLTFLDNSFMSPLYQQPLNLGIDVVLHSATKFLSGHSDVIAGLAVTKDEALADELGRIQNSCGAILATTDCFTLIQNMKTLDVRMQKSSTNAQIIASFLSAHPFVKRVYYPGLENHSGYEIHKKQATHGGAILSFELPSRKATKAFVEHLQIPMFAVSLGGVESILSYPAQMSHAAMPKEEREKRGITDSLLRLSVGLENVDDLINDFKQAFDHAQKVH